MEGLPCTVILLIVLVTIVSSFKIPTNDTKAAGCAININSLPANTPLLLNSTRGIIFPDIGGSIVNLPTNQRVDLDCPGTGNVVAATTRAPPVEAICISGTNFDILGEVVDLSTVLCSSRITSAAIPTGRSCWGTGVEIEIGLVTRGDGTFIPLITSCFDDVLRNVLYSQYYLTKQIEDRVTGGTSPSWTEGGFYNLGATVNNIYPKVAHRAAINRQIGLEDTDEKYVKSTGHYYLAKGHLTARTDFMYNGQQMATFNYINSAPQWQTFNGYNWYYFERNLRVYATANSVDLIVYTGTYGISTLPHERTGVPVEIYFYVDNNGNKAMPIPELFWKLAYDPLNRAGVVVLGINNPYQLDVEKSILCNDIADELTWLTFDRFKIESGYTYACTIEEFRKIIPNIPNFDVRSILN